MKVENLVKRYPNGYCALRGVSFETPSHGLICITGESGSGKSTLLNCIFGIEDFEGRIVVDGIELNKNNCDVIRKQYMSMIYQDYQLIEDLSVEDNLYVAAECVGIRLTQDDILVSLRRVGLKDELAVNKVNTLSGGEKQRVGIARALAQKSNILLADEPTGNLDSKNSESIFELLKSLSNELLIIAVTHNITLSQRYGDYYIELRDGEILSTNIDKTDSSVIAVDNGKVVLDIKKTKLSGKNYLKMIRWTGKNKIMSVLLTVFSVMLLTAIFVLSSFLLSNDYNIERRNIKYRDPHILSITNGFRYNNHTYEGIDGIYNGFYGTYGYMINDEETNMSTNYIKYDGNNPNTNIECNDVAKLNLKLICGRNVEAYDEIIINESLAFQYVDFGYFGDKKVSGYEELLGLESNGIRIVGIIDGGYDKYKGKYKDYTNQQFMDASEEEQSDMRSIKSMLNNNVDMMINVVKEGYSEITRNDLNSLNSFVARRIITSPMTVLDTGTTKFDVYSGGGYTTFDETECKERLSDTEIILSKKFLDQLYIKGDILKPFELKIKVGDYACSALVVGYTEDDMSYVSQGFFDDYYNNNADIYIQAFFPSKTKNLDEIYEKCKLSNSIVEPQLISGFTPGIRDIADFFESYNVLFLILLLIVIALLIMFNCLSAYIILRQKRSDILILRGLGMDKKTLCFAYIASFAFIALIQIVGAMLIYGIGISALNSLIMNSSAVACNALFFEPLATLLVSMMTLFVTPLFVIWYLSVLFTKRIGYRKKHA